MICYSQILNYRIEFTIAQLKASPKLFLASVFALLYVNVQFRLYYLSTALSFVQEMFCPRIRSMTYQYYQIQCSNCTPAYYFRLFTHIFIPEPIRTHPLPVYDIYICMHSFCTCVTCLKSYAHFKQIVTKKFKKLAFSLLYCV